MSAGTRFDLARADGVCDAPRGPPARCATDVAARGCRPGCALADRSGDPRHHWRSPTRASAFRQYVPLIRCASRRPDGTPRKRSVVAHRAWRTSRRIAHSPIASRNVARSLPRRAMHARPTKRTVLRTVSAVCSCGPGLGWPARIGDYIQRMVLIAAITASRSAGVAPEVPTSSMHGSRILLLVPTVPSGIS